ncbi:MULTISPECIES: hypothetical protein [Microbacterium]|uniref:hypothetical protein n=1 Tax=Microbacterium TaxID=33882 RepID=UPI000D642098|nr:MULTISPECIES: hypothetical protein [Microbacterium]
MSTNQPIDPDTGQPVEPTIEEERAPRNGDASRDGDATLDRSDDDLIMDEVLIEDDPGSSSDR